MIALGVRAVYFYRLVSTFATELSKFSLLCRFKTLVNPRIKFMDLSSYEVKGFLRTNSLQSLTVFLNVMGSQIPFGGHRTDCGVDEIWRASRSNISNVPYIPVGKTGCVEMPMFLGALMQVPCSKFKPTQLASH